MLSTQDTRLAKTLTHYALLISLLVGISLPVGYALTAYNDLTKSLSFKAKIKANAQADLITTLPDTWMYAENRLQGVLSREPVRLDNEYIQILDPEGETITSSGTALTGLTVQRSYPLYDIDKIVGNIVVSASLSTLYKNILLAILFGFVLALLILLVLRLLPIRALQQISDELYTEKERAVTTLHSIADAILLSDINGNLIYLNLPAEKMLGKPFAELKGKSIADYLLLTDMHTGFAIDSTLQETLHSGSVATCNERSMLEISGDLKIAVEERSTPIFDQRKKLVGGVLCLRDVTVAREYLERQSWEATHDLLTGLVNRREFENRVTKAIDNTIDNGQTYIVYYMDLDRFKIINDSCGHSAGDDVLQQLSRIMSSKIRANDTLARLGGDEFGLILECCDETRGKLIAQTLLNAIEKFQMVWEKQIYTVGISIGFTEIVNDSFSCKEIIGQADSACYWAKEQGRHQVCQYKESDIELADRRSQTGWVGRINSALKDDRFVLYHQIYRSLTLNDESCLHLEVLLRMVSNEGEIILPGHFLPAAERYNLITKIDRWVINKVLSGFHLLQKIHQNKTLIVNINLSGLSINSLDLFEYIKHKIIEYNIEPQCLCFEITETSAVKDMHSAIEFITACKEIGVKFALDDFGTGSSSFGYLKNLPVDYLKIDGSFVKNLENDAVDRAITQTINQIGHIMGKITIAEFAENQSIIEILDEMGVDFAQGYGVCRPIPLFPDNDLEKE
ncbi:EAL domain-containing protein [Shewanella sp. MEBiC00475]|uniref:EAL domain-containing protein n=1 Tax=Shewanella sp. MEBiC00475 TaxID=2575361 RepID=UPI0010BF9773|nr:EAL domain-containing protein [Shewanella sp. MEBiC00475]